MSLLSERSSEDHGRHNFGRNGFECIRTLTRTVTHTITHEVGNSCGVPGVVFGDTLLDLPDQIRTNVGALRVDATASLGKHGNERSPEPVPDNKERGLVDR